MFGILYWLVLASLIFLTLRRPYYAYCAFLCIFGLEQWGQLYVPLLRQVSYLSNILILIPIWVACALHINRSILPDIGQFIGQRRAIVFLYVYAGFSLLWTPSDLHGFELWAPVLPYILTGILVVPLCMQSTFDYQIANQRFILIGGGLMLLLAFVPQWGARAIIIAGSKEQIGLPLALGELAGYVLITASLYLGKERLSWVLFGLSALGSLVVAIKSGSRGPLIFSVLTVMAVLPIALRGGVIKKYVGGAFVGLILALVIIEIFSAAGVYTDRWELDMILSDFSARMSGAVMLLEAALKSPFSMLFGLGNSASFSGSLLGMYPHMVPLEVLAEEGLVGAALWIFIFVSAIRQIRYVKTPLFDNVQDRRAFMTIFGCFLFSTLLSFKQGSLISFSIPFVFAALQERYLALKSYEIITSETQIETQYQQ